MYEKSTCSNIIQRLTRENNRKNSQKMVNMKDIILEEKDESNNESNIIHITKHDITVNDRNKDKQFLSHRKRDVRKLKQIFLDLFLPVGYPESLEDPACYINYQFFDSLQALCSYLRGVISTSAMLQAAGVGNSDATALSSAMVRCRILCL